MLNILSSRCNHSYICIGKYLFNSPKKTFIFVYMVSINKNRLKKNIFLVVKKLGMRLNWLLATKTGWGYPIYNYQA